MIDQFQEFSVARGWLRYQHNRQPVSVSLEDVIGAVKSQYSIKSSDLGPPVFKGVELREK